MGEVTLLFSSYVSWPTPPASLTSHSNGQERQGLVQISEGYHSYYRTSEVEEKLKG